MNKERRAKLSNIEDTLNEINADSMDLRGIKKIVSDCRSRLDNVANEEGAAYDNLLPSLQDGERGEAIQAALTAIEEADDAFENIHDVEMDEDEPEAWREVVSGYIEEAIDKLQEAQG